MKKIFAIAASALVFSASAMSARMAATTQATVGSPTRTSPKFGNS
jgi:hypothetical protein